MMLGAIIGDIVGSIYEWNNIKTKDFEFFKPNCRFTDDSVMTCAIAKAIMIYKTTKDKEVFRVNIIREMQQMGRKYLNAGYGGNFIKWIVSENPQPYNSYGNGSAMRVSPVAWFASSLEEAEELANISASVSHNHPEGIIGAQATAAAIYMALNKLPKERIKSYLENKYYDLKFTLTEIRPQYSFDVSCQGSVPQAIVAFLESTSYEDAVRNAVSLGGDSDTIAAITGSIAEAYYGIPEAFKKHGYYYLDEELSNIVAKFYSLLED